ncbi:MAG: type I restriction enzyme HsdR N-terminal domain-containing protein [Chitinophagaceae bacterium]
MLQINFPDHDFKIKKKNNATIIFDVIRKKWLELTPEEWVRQNFVQYLIQEKKYPGACIALEKLFMLGEMKKRFDIVVYKDHLPWILIECKKENIPLQESILKQVLIYHQVLKTDILVITNGRQSFAAKVKEGSFEFIEDLPVW